MNRLIVTADDYGMCPSVNRAIEECMAAGGVTSTCVMTNMDAFADAASLRSKIPATASIGLHWTVSQGRPVCPVKTVPTLVAADGQFLRSGEYRARWLLGKISPAELRRELVAQYERYRATVGAPEYWNTHENVHVNPGLFRFFVELAAELQIPAMRCHRRVCHPPLSCLTNPRFWLKGQVLARWSRWAARRGMKMPDMRLYVRQWDERVAQFGRIAGDVRWPAGATLELPIHPAVEVDRKLFGDLTELRTAEYRVFRDPALVQELKNAGVELVSFNALT
jgi:chitin disaccharide deacetylase